MSLNFCLRRYNIFVWQIKRSMEKNELFGFLKTNPRGAKPRKEGITEIRGPYYTVSRRTDTIFYKIYYSEIKKGYLSSRSFKEKVPAFTGSTCISVKHNHFVKSS